MKKEKLFLEFEELGQRLGVKILKGKGNFAGGTCVVNDKKVIVVNNMKPLEHRLKTLATSFLKYNLDDVYMVPALRAYIEESRSLDL
jgi:hypothetical protein|tara:strand:- start:2371 stop:2631 length:261 start_codon:yes stop_codon:yes gene_type:complete